MSSQPEEVVSARLTKLAEAVGALQGMVEHELAALRAQVNAVTGGQGALAQVVASHEEKLSAAPADPAAPQVDILGEHTALAEHVNASMKQFDERLANLEQAHVAHVDATDASRSLLADRVAAVEGVRDHLDSVNEQLGKVVADTRNVATEAVTPAVKGVAELRRDYEERISQLEAKVVELKSGLFDEGANIRTATPAAG